MEGLDSESLRQLDLAMASERYKRYTMYWVQEAHVWVLISWLGVAYLGRRGAVLWS
jgi:hypothetical protein